MRTSLWGWAVVGAIILLLLGTGVNFMTSARVIPADVLFIAAAVLLLVRFITWEETRQATNRTRALVICVISTVTLLGCIIAANHLLNATSDAKARFHMTQIEVGFDKDNANIIDANVYFQNDGGDAEINSRLAGATGPVITDQEKLAEWIEGVNVRLRKEPLNSRIRDTIHSKESRWTTVRSPILSRLDLQAFSNGSMAYYFLGELVATEGGTTRANYFCGYVLGNNRFPDGHLVVQDCPIVLKPRNKLWPF